MGARRLGVPATKKRPYFQSFMKVGQELEMPRPGEGEGREGRWAERRPPPQARGNLGPRELPNREPRGLRVSLGKSGVSGFIPVGAQECWEDAEGPPPPPSVGLWEEQAAISCPAHPAGFPADSLDPAGPTLGKLSALGSHFLLAREEERSLTGLKTNKQEM